MMREAKGKQIYLIESDGIKEHNHILKMTQKGKTRSGHHLNQSRLKRGQKIPLPRPKISQWSGYNLTL